MVATTGFTSRTTATINQATTPKIYVVPMASANTEYSQALTAGTKAVRLFVRPNGSSASELKLYFSSGSAEYATIPNGVSWIKENIDFTGTLYFQCTKAGETLEIEEWT